MLPSAGSGASPSFLEPAAAFVNHLDDLKVRRCLNVPNTKLNACLFDFSEQLKTLAKWRLLTTSLRSTVLGLEVGGNLNTEAPFTCSFLPNLQKKWRLEPGRRLQMSGQCKRTLPLTATTSGPNQSILYAEAAARAQKPKIQNSRDGRLKIKHEKCLSISTKVVWPRLFMLGCHITREKGEKKVGKGRDKSCI